MTRFQELIQNYGGDPAAVSIRFMDDMSFYLQILGMLPQDTSVASLDAALRAGDLAAAFDAAHTLKGVSGNLCLTPLYNAACAIVEPLRQRETRDYAPLFQTVQQEYDRALALLSDLQQAGAD